MISLAVGTTVNNLFIRAKDRDKYLAVCDTCGWGDWFVKSKLLSHTVKCKDCFPSHSRAQYSQKVQRMLEKHERRLHQMGIYE